MQINHKFDRTSLGSGVHCAEENQRKQNRSKLDDKVSLIFYIKEIILRSYSEDEFYNVAKRFDHNQRLNYELECEFSDLCRFMNIHLGEYYNLEYKSEAFFDNIFQNKQINWEKFLFNNYTYEEIFFFLVKPFIGSFNKFTSAFDMIRYNYKNTSEIYFLLNEVRKMDVVTIIDINKNYAWNYDYPYFKDSGIHWKEIFFNLNTNEVKQIKKQIEFKKDDTCFFLPIKIQKTYFDKLVWSR